MNLFVDQFSAFKNLHDRKHCPNPTGTATEEQRIEYICALIEASKVLWRQGGDGSLSAIRWTLRPAIMTVWEEREYRKFDPRRLRSARASTERNSKKLTYEHVVPLRVVSDLLLTSSGQPDTVGHILRTYVLGCVVHVEEDRRLRELGLAKKMPDGWDQADCFARYRMAGISISGHC